MIRKYTSYQNKFFITLLLAVFTFFSNSIYASDDVEEAKSEHVAEANDTEHSDDKVDITKVAFEHILDSHSWHLWGEGHDAVAIPLPVVLYSTTKGLQFFSSAHFEHGHASYNGYKLQEEQILSEDSNEIIYDLSITKNVASMLISVLIIVLIFTSVAKTYKKTGITSAPKGKQSFFEPLIIFVRDDIAKNNIGTKSTKFVPYLLTLFFFILINNLLGMLPFGANLTGNIAFTLVLSVITLIVTNVNGNAQYWHHLFMPPAPKWLYPILIPIELVGILTKPFALMIRLFANITAGHIIIISLVGLIFIFKSLAVSPISVAFALFIDVLECLVAFLQAYIFTMLTALFIGSAVADHHEEHSHDDDDKHLAKSH